MIRTWSSFITSSQQGSETPFPSVASVGSRAAHSLQRNSRSWTVDVQSSHGKRIQNRPEGLSLLPTSCSSLIAHLSMQHVGDKYIYVQQENLLQGLSRSQKVAIKFQLPACHGFAHSVDCNRTVTNNKMALYTSLETESEMETPFFSFICTESCLCSLAWVLHESTKRSLRRCPEIYLRSLLRPVGSPLGDGTSKGSCCPSSEMASGKYQPPSSRSPKALDALTPREGWARGSWPICSVG